MRHDDSEYVGFRARACRITPALALMLGIALASAVGARDTAPAPALTEADRAILTRIVVETWAPHVEPEHLEGWLESVEERAGSVPLGWVEAAAAALDLRSMELALEGLAPLDAPMPAAFGDPGGNLVFNPLPPCRLLDTRQPSPRGGVIPNNTERTFKGYNVNFQTVQGGANSNCGLTWVVQPEALAITLVAVNPGGDGYLTAYPTGGERPLAASLNYTTGSVASTGLILPINNDWSVDEFSIYTWRAAHVVADVTGYFSRPQAAAFDCTDGEVVSFPLAGGSNHLFSAPTCPDNYTAYYGGCESSSPNGVLVTTRAVGTTHCTFRNQGAQSITVSAYNRCCRVPGR